MSEEPVADTPEPTPAPEAPAEPADSPEPEPAPEPEAPIEPEPAPEPDRAELNQLEALIHKKEILEILEYLNF